MKNTVRVALGALLLACSLAHAGDWELDPEQSEIRLFDRANFVYHSTASARRPYDIDLSGQTPGTAGSIRLDFAAQSIVITGLELPLPIDTDARVFASLRQVCDELISACDQGKAPTATTVALGTAQCSVEYVLPDSLRSVALVNVRHSSGERFSITQAGFVAFALREVERLRRGSITRFDTTAKNLKAESGAIFAAALVQKYNPTGAIASTLEQFKPVRPILESVLASECDRASAEASAILTQEANRLTKSFQERIDLGRETCDAGVSEFVARTLGSEALQRAQLPNGLHDLQAGTVPLPDSSSIENAIEVVTENLRMRLAAAVDKTVMERMGRPIARVIADESALVRKIAVVSRGSMTYTAAEQEKVDLMNALASAMQRHDVSPSDLNAQRTLKALTIEVGGLGRFSPNPEYTELVTQLDRLRQETVSRLGVKIEGLVAFTESRPADASPNSRQ